MINMNNSLLPIIFLNKNYQMLLRNLLKTPMVGSFDSNTHISTVVISLHYIGSIFRRT